MPAIFRRPLTGHRAPLSVSGLTVWVDAAEITGIADGGAITTCPDLIGNGVVVNQTTSANKPVYELVSGVPTIRFWDGAAANRYFSVSSVTLQVSDITVFVLAKDNAPTATAQKTLVALGGNHLTRTIGANLKMVGWSGTNNAQFSSGVLMPAGEWIGVFTSDSTGTAAAEGVGVRATVNGVSNFRTKDTNNSTVNSSAVTSIVIGVGNPTNTFQFNGYIRSLLIYNRKLSLGEQNKIVQYLRSRRAGPAPTAVTKQIVFDGDSLTAGATGTTTADAQTYPEGVLITQSAFKSSNLGISGATIVNLTSDAATQVDALYNPELTNILVAWAGTNDLLNNVASGTNANDRYVAFKAYCEARQTAGWQVVALTCLPRGSNATFETHRQEFNTLVRGDTSFYDALADVGADTTIGEAGDQDNTTYYQSDKIHMTPAGYAVVAGLVNTAIASL